MLKRILQFLSTVASWCKNTLIKLEGYVNWFLTHPLFFSFLEKCEYYSSTPAKVLQNFFLLSKQTYKNGINFFEKILTISTSFFYYLSSHEKVQFIHVFFKKCQVFFKDFKSYLTKCLFDFKIWLKTLPNTIKICFLKILKYINKKFGVFFFKLLKFLKKIYTCVKNFILEFYFTIKTSVTTLFAKKALTNFYFFRWFLVYGIGILIFKLTLGLNKFFFKNKLLIKKADFIEYHPHIRKFIIFFYQPGNSLSRWQKFDLENLNTLNKERQDQKFYPFYFYQTLELIRFKQTFFFKNRSIKEFKTFYKFFKIKNTSKSLPAVFLNFCSFIMKHPLIFSIFKKNTTPQTTIYRTNFYNYIYMCDVLIKPKTTSSLPKPPTKATTNKNTINTNLKKNKIWVEINTSRIKKIFKNKIIYTNFFQKISQHVKLTTITNFSNFDKNTLNVSVKQFLENYPIKINTQFEQLTTEMWPTRTKPTVFYQNIDQHHNTNQVNFFLRKIKIFNKNRYSRNRQLYRTGVYMCLYINVIFVYFYFFSFYRFAFVFGYLWIGVGLLLLSLSFSRAMKYRLYNHSNFVSEIWEFSNWIVQFYNSLLVKIKTLIIEFKDIVLGRLFIYWKFNKIFKLAKYKKNKNPHRASLRKILFFEKKLVKYFGMLRRYLYKFNTSSTNPNQHFWILIKPDAFQARIVKKKFFKKKFFKKNIFKKLLTKIYRFFSKHQRKN